MKEIQCKRCQEYKPLDEMESGRVSPTYCKDCKRAKNRERYAKNPEKWLAQQRIYRKTEAGKKANMTKWRKLVAKSPEKVLARYKLNLALVNGEITKSPCEVCGEVKVDAHHHLGYAEQYWYDVQWLCRVHHHDVHGFSLKSKGVVQRQDS